MNSQDHINPQGGTAPVCIGTNDFARYFKCAIDNMNLAFPILDFSKHSYAFPANAS
jgi:hypothetical protein